MPIDEEIFKGAFDDIKMLKDHFSQIILGKEDFIEYILTGFLSGGHILIEDVPGLGKTTAAKALSKLIDGTTTSRIQCTPDLLPYDITGVEFYDAKDSQFRFEPGPVFADIVLADELNRANPRTQSALLEAMAESQVTISNKTYPLSPLFFVIATQNPIDNEASYRLPLAELDRFLFKLTMGYPSLVHETALLNIKNNKTYLSNITPAITINRITEIRNLIPSIHCSDALIHLVACIAQATRKDPRILLGASPRASMQIVHAAKAIALLRNRSFVTDEDIKEIITIALPHRLRSVDDSKDLEPILLEIYQKAWSNSLGHHES
ncbi:MoxR family ATPase [Entomospira entomophila]|uniref:MoxR family ATPase n=1 Tax=Entomospira entomophila TaxID=2719988 RepID=A0A968KU07_9SPIO|nr:MoxR family ATPase [Entomospira entomophilus]NIZ40936.1 MoxR family ATPase [Entomospira entomophilus]WDI35149.1 MoxR family ATPase [Entomospira entomophilus]